MIEQLGLDWDFSDYKPLSDWMPCPSYDAVQKRRIRPDRRPFQVSLRLRQLTATRIRGSTKSASGPTPTTSCSTNRWERRRASATATACGWNRRCKRSGPRSS